MLVHPVKLAMGSRKQSVCSGVSGVSKGDEQDVPLASALQLYPFAVALRIRVLQIVCGISGMVVGAVGWLEEKHKPVLGLGVPAGAITTLAAATSIYFSRGFGGWVSARSRTTANWGVPWRALGPSPWAAIPLTLLWITTLSAHIAMLVFCMKSLLCLGCSSPTCKGVAGAQLTVSLSTLGSVIYMLQLDLRFDAALSPPPQSEIHTCTAVSMVPLTSVALNSGNSGDAMETGSPPGKEKDTLALKEKDSRSYPAKEKNVPSPKDKVPDPQLRDKEVSTTQRIVKEVLLFDEKEILQKENGSPVKDSKKDEEATLQHPPLPKPPT